MRKILLPLALGALLATGAQAEPLPQSFRAHLLAYDTVPTADELAALAPDPAKLLVRAADDDGLSGYERARAISLLSLFPEPRTLDMLDGLARRGPEELRAVAVYMAGRTFGAIDPDRALAVVRGSLAAEPARVREYAVRALRWIDRPDAVREALRGRQAVEPDASVTRTITRTLERLDAREVTP